MNMKRIITYILLLSTLLGSSLQPLLGAEEAAVAAEITADAEAEAAAFTTMEEFQAMPLAYPKFMVDNLWILMAAALVFLMHLGFATIESGLTRQKNTVNILFKNVFIISMGVLTYSVWGFNAMYPGDAWSIPGIFAMGSPIANGFEGAAALDSLTSNYADYTYWSDFIFQAMFAATAATIVSGAVAERIKLGSFMIGATILVAVAYPITGSWKWGAGWLDSMGFYDFAGSTLVHAFGGFAALAAVLLLGARRGKYVNGQIKPVLGHSMPLATIGALLLFLGWFGFNGGSVLSADPTLVSLVFVTTAMAGCAGGLAAMFFSWIWLKKPDLSMALNGLLAGLVGITAGADVISPFASVLVGAIAGVLVVASVVILDKIKIDDPVGAISVHGTCGIWGTLAVGIFGGSDFSFTTQLIGTLSISAFAFIFSLIVFGLIKATVGLRVSEQEEEQGLDVGEHGVASYPNFQPAVDY